jgi:hypothetical protein
MQGDEPLVHYKEGRSCLLEGVANFAYDCRLQGLFSFRRENPLWVSFSVNDFFPNYTVVEIFAE